MILKLLSVEKTESGLFIITLTIDSKSYSYKISSDFALKKAERFYRKGWNGKALNLIKAFSLKGE